MKKDLIIFGIGKIADVIFYYAKEECDFNVVAFSADREYINSKEFNGLPVIPFDEIEKEYTPDSYEMFIAVGYQDLNRLRETKCQEARNKGYKLVSIISTKANLPSNVKVGTNCFIMSPSLIHPCVEIGDNVFIFSGAMIAHHSILENNCWLTSCCNISGNVRIGANTFVAVNATVGHSVNIGKNCFLGANTLVTKNLEDEKVVIQESNKPLRLTSKQFLKFSNFSSL
jgi:sugar O-acyltransferase (sialic acid O-acetyltransferase NeuD family)